MMLPHTVSSSKKEAIAYFFDRNLGGSFSYPSCGSQFGSCLSKERKMHSSYSLPNCITNNMQNGGLVGARVCKLVQVVNRSTPD
jgi:hypothetical protein